MSSSNGLAKKLTSGEVREENVSGAVLSKEPAFLVGFGTDNGFRRLGSVFQFSQ